MKKLALLMVSIVVAITMKAAAPDGYLPLDWTYTFPSWNDYPDIELYSDVQTSEYQGRINIAAKDHVDAHANIIADVDITVPSYICIDFEDFSQINIYVDNTLTETIESIRNRSYSRFSINAGHHQIRVEHIQENHTCGVRIKTIGIIKTPLITVNLLEPGSLGTEILYNGVERLQDVRNLKVIGTMNDADLEKISMMKNNLVFVDLSEASFKTLPANTFSLNYGETQFLNSVILPEGLESIGSRAFSQSTVNHVNFPSTLKGLGDGVFSSSNIREAILPSDLATLPEHCFSYCQNLKNVHLPDNVEKIGSCCFLESKNVIITETPSKLKRVEGGAFEECAGVNFELPASLEFIGASAFNRTNQLSGNGVTIRETLNIPNGCEVEQFAFLGSGYTTAVLPVSFYKITGLGHFLPDDIKNIRLNSPTIVIPETDIIYKNNLPNVNLEVPSYLVNAYKLDPYWYNCATITGFDTNEVEEWIIQADLVLGARERMLGTPSIIIKNGASLKINGTDGMPLNNLTLINEIGWGTFSPSQFISNTDGITVTGELSFDINFKNSTHYSNIPFWYYLSLPFDCNVSEIEAKEGGQIAIRYYDGASRAENGAIGNWTDFDTNAVIPAGTGFIVSVSEPGTWNFKAVNNESKQYLTSRNMFVKALASNPSDNRADKGWNLVGNPYQCYYNIHKLNFSAPITVRDLNNNNYVAYSIIDDDYALKPNEAIFVQCPDDVASIAFPTEGRQLTAEITSQQGAPTHNPQVSDRRLTDVVISFGEYTDRTRVVINEIASTEYEINCDAAKFMGDGVQIYTIGADDVQYAINERPMADGMVTLGFTAPEDGMYTISLNRNNNEHVYIIDNETGEVTEITYGEYMFSCKKGTHNKKFSLSFENSTTAISSIQSASFKVAGEKGSISIIGANGTVDVYDLTGKKVASVETTDGTSISVNAGVYMVRSGSNVAKVVVK